MFSRKSRTGYESTDLSGFWIPYSDLMAGMLGIFALLLVTTVYKLGDPLQNVKEVLEERQQVVEELKVKFFTDKDVEITDAGALRMKGEVLFEINGDTLSPGGRELLLRVMPKYLDVVLSFTGFKEHLNRILVEGHADPTYRNDDSLAAYIYNLDLSQRRAAHVVSFLIEDPEMEMYRPILKKYVMASGRSSTDLVFDDSGLPDYDRSRRIQIDFVMKDQDLLQKVLTRMFPMFGIEQDE